MKRREALKLTSTILGGTIVGSQVFLSGCMLSKSPEELFSEAHVNLMDEIGETILPESDKSPGAKAAHIGQFMKVIVRDCYDKNETELFMSGLSTIENKSVEKHGHGFLAISPEERHVLLAEFDKLAHDQNGDNSIHFFTMIKQLTIWGYFTSEPGATKALRYNPIPGRFEGCISYQLGDKAWA